MLLILSAGTSAPLLITGVFLFGFGIGNATSMPPLIAQQEFPKAEVQRVVSLIVAGAQAACAFAPVCFAYVHALSAAHIEVSSVSLFATAGTVQALAILLMLVGARRPAPKLAVSRR